MAYTTAYTTIGPYGNPIPWYTRRDAPAYRPFGAFANSKPTPPPRTAFGPSPEELEEERKEAAFWAWQHELSTTPGTPLQPRLSPGLAGKTARPCWYEEGLATMALRAITTRTSAAKQRGQKWRDGALDSYRRVAFRIERWYWLNKIAYEQSSWPATLRLVRGVLLGLLVLALALWLWKMNLDEKENERRQPYYELAPRYQAWSVSKITYEG